MALAVRQIKAGAEINDSYGAVYHHMDKAERQQFLQVGKPRETLVSFLSSHSGKI